MLTKLTGGVVYDPLNGVNGQPRDLYIKDGKLVDTPKQGGSIDREIDLKGQVVMAGAIDAHSHIGGGKVTIARILMPEDHQHDAVDSGKLTRAGCGHAVPSTLTTGYRYA